MAVAGLSAQNHLEPSLKQVILRNGGPEYYIITTLSVAVNFRQTDWFTKSTLKPILAIMQEHQRNTNYKNDTEVNKASLLRHKAAYAFYPSVTIYSSFAVKIL